MEGFLDDLPTFRHAQQREQVGHVCAAVASHGAGPARNFQTNENDRVKNVDADKARPDSGSRAIPVDPVEQEMCSDGEIGSGIAKKCGVRMKGGANLAAGVFGFLKETSQREVMSTAVNRLVGLR